MLFWWNNFVVELGLKLLYVIDDISGRLALENPLVGHYQLLAPCHQVQSIVSDQIVHGKIFIN